MRIAILGTRGVPARYGGFETFAEQLSRRLVERGHDVTVYCRNGNAEGRPSRHAGVELVHLPAVRHKYAETPSHTLLSAVHAAFRRFDVVYVCNSANAPICLIPRLRGQRTVLNVDGLEWRRKKWSRFAQRYYQWAAALAARLPIEVVTDAHVVQAYYRERFHRQTRYFAYGTELYERGYMADRLRALELEPNRYILYVSRLEPENNALLVVQAYREVATDIPLVIVGDAPYAREYIEQLRSAADSRVVFLGYRFGDDYHALQANALVYVQATEVGGTHPALVEALGHGNAILAHDVPEHREVLGDAGVYFDFRDPQHLSRQLAALLDAPDEIPRLQDRALRRAGDHYSWPSITDAYEKYFEELVGRKPGGAVDN